MGSIITAATDLAAQLDALPGVRATIDPAKANTSRPCVLVTPPSIDYSRRANVWTLALLSSKPTGDLAALRELDALLQAVLPHIDAETATPAAYALTPETGTVPAYLVRITT